MSEEITKSGDILVHKPPTRVPIRDYLKDLSIQKIQAEKGLEDLTKEYLARKEVIDLRIEELEAKVSALNPVLDEAKILELSKDRNAFNLMKQAFPDTFDLEGEE